MASINSWSPVVPEMVWSKVLVSLRKEFGEDCYLSYLARATIVAGPMGDPILVTPTIYARDWFVKNALSRTHALWAQYDPDSRKLDIKSRIDFDDLMSLTPVNNSGAQDGKSSIVHFKAPMSAQGQNAFKWTVANKGIDGRA